MGTVHSGTHVVALSHITCGERHEWFGASNADEHLGDFGPLRGDPTEIPPLIARGVLIDVAGARGVEALGAHEAIGADELRDVLDGQGVELETGDVALIRTGYLSGWPDANFIAAHQQAGIDRDAALWLASLGVVAVGADTEALEVLPSTVAGNPHPVHLALLGERGIFIIEMVDCEELARDRVYEFCFVCLPLSVRGATGSMVRPVALVEASPHPPGQSKPAPRPPQANSAIGALTWSPVPDHASHGGRIRHQHKRRSSLAEIAPLFGRVERPAG